MRTEAQIAASRANGRRSQGPVTPEGKARSSQNAFRHGLLAECVVLVGEETANFQAYLDQHIARFLPADDVEMNLVEEMVSAAWRERRATGLQTIFFNTGFANAAPSGNEGQDVLDAVNKLADSPAIRLLHRYEVHHHRVYYRCIDTLIKLQKSRPAEPAVPNEPEPAPAPSDPVGVDRRSSGANSSLPPAEPALPNEPKPAIGPHPYPEPLTPLFTAPVQDAQNTDSPRDRYWSDSDGLIFLRTR
jgi:hypothetical protein